MPLNHQKARQLLGANKPQEALKFLQVPQGKTTEAETLFLQGLSFQQLNRPKDAESAWKQSLQHGVHIGSGNRLAMLYARTGRSVEAKDLLHKVLSADPNNHETINSLALLTLAQGKGQEAIALLRAALAKAPGSQLLNQTLAQIYRQLGQGALARETYLRLVQLAPKEAQYWVDLALCYFAENNFFEAEKWFEKSASHHRGHAQLALVAAQNARHLNLLQLAINRINQAIELAPNNAEIAFEKGSILMKQGNARDALEAYQRVLELNPKSTSAASNVALLSNYLPDLDKREVMDRHCDYSKVIVDDEKSSDPEFQSAGGRLRVGILSSDMKAHSVSYFLLPLLRHYDRSKIELVCYSAASIQDHMSREIAQLVDVFHHVFKQNNQQLREQILSDQLDILLELNGLTGGSRLSALASRVAPVQVAWLGYPNTTGMDTMDFRITDAYCDPSSEDEYYTEALVRLDHGFLCHTGLPDCQRNDDFPGYSSRRVTFGSFNNRLKITDQVIDVWAEILGSVPESDLLLKNASFSAQEACDEVYKAFSERSVDTSRIRLVGVLPDTSEHLALYNCIDIALDTFPYNGTTTTCEALLMGVPVVALNGDRHASRVSASILNQIGKPDWIAEDQAAYVDLAADLANRVLAGSMGKKSDIRDAVDASPLRDESGFAKRFGEKLGALGSTILA